MKLKILIHLLFILPCALTAQDIELLTPKLLKLGKVQEGTVVSDTLRFLNTGNKTVTIERVRSSCGCTTTTLDIKKIAPGDTGFVSFALNTRGFKGVLRKTITVVFEEDKLNPLEFSIQATVYTNWETTPRYIHFYRISFNPDTTLSKILEIENYSDHIIKVLKIQSGDPKIRVSPASGAIQSGRKLFVQVQMTPDQVGTMHNTIDILTDDEHKPNLKVPVYMHVIE
jgi:hypothetical protein